MLKTVEATVEKNGEVHLLEKITVSHKCKAIVTILDYTDPQYNETSLLSEKALSEDWNRQEEDEAWSDLQ